MGRNSTLPEGTRQERTGWRDMDLSLRHRSWGYNCPAVDLDFLVVEYNFGKPVAIIEYKFHKVHKMADPNHPTYRAIMVMCDRASLPFAIVYYRKDPWGFMAEPCNDAAGKIFTKWEILSEYEYVIKLYRMRGNQMSKDIAAILNKEIPNPYDFSNCIRK